MRSFKKFDNTHVGLTIKEIAQLSALKTPTKVQDFISLLPQNFEVSGDSCMSVREVLRMRRAHCIEGALVAALAFWINGEKPLLMDLAASDADDDHVIALFKRDGYWGAISKGNHSVLLYRDPIYRTLRELAMSYVHEYSNKKGDKTLRAYSLPLNLSRYKPEAWITGCDAWKIAEELCRLRHFPLLSKTQERNLRPLEAVERRAGKITAYSR